MAAAAVAPKMPDSASPQHPPPPSPPVKSFKFFRSSLQETLRNATGGKSKAQRMAAASHAAAQPATASEDGVLQPSTSERKRAVLRKPDSGGKARAGHAAASSSSAALQRSAGLPGWTSMQTPSLSQASMSSPDLLMSLAASSASHSPSPPIAQPRQRRASQLQPIQTSSSSGAAVSRPVLLPKDREPSSPRSPRPSLQPGASSSQSPGRPGRLHAASASTSHLPTTPSSPRATSPTSPTHAARVARVSISGHTRTSSTSMTTSPPPASPSTQASHPPSSQRRPSYPGLSRNTPSPSPTPQRRVVSPVYLGHRQNPSTTSLAPSPHRELIRTASAYLAKEFARRPPHFAVAVWQEVEVRLRALFRLERIWGRGGGGASSSGVGSGSAGLGGGEERERRIFLEALRDGYVLCQLINKFQPGMIARADAHEDGFVKTSNVTKFLSAATSFGVPPAELFGRDDLLEGSAETLAHVAQTIVSLCKLAEQPRQQRVSRSPYMGTAGSASQPSLPASASLSTPNLVSRRPSSPPNVVAGKSTAASPSAAQKKRWTPPSPALPTVRSASPVERSARATPTTTTSRSKTDSAPRDASTTPEPPRREAASPPPSSSISTPTAAAVAFPSSHSPPRPPRQGLISNASSRASIASTLATATTGDVMSRSSKFGTIRTMNTEVTEATSLHPSDGRSSLTKSEASHAISAAEGVETSPVRTRPQLGGKFTFPERASSESMPGGSSMLDLGRVPEVDEEAGTRRKAPPPLQLDREASSSPTRTASTSEKPRLIPLGKGKWPDDFIGLGHPSSPMRIPSRSEKRDSLGSPTTAMPISITPPHRKLSIKSSALSESPKDPSPLAGAERPFGARRPSHRSRHSVDTAGLLPKDSPLVQAALARERSPSITRDRRDSNSTPPPAPGILRRQSTRSSPRGSYVPKSPDYDRGERSPYWVPSSDNPMSGANASTPTLANGRGVPFPKAKVSIDTNGKTNDSVDISSRPSTTETLHADDFDVSHQPSASRPGYQRGRHQSEMDATRRKARPISYDDGGSRPGRSRFESMINLGVTSASSSTNDLTRRDSMMSNSGLKPTIIVREEGKTPMHYQLGNCVGKGQFGAVYRALNLNTGATVAIKRIRLGGLKESEVEQLMKEVTLVKSLSHPSIVKYEGMLRDDEYLNIVLEYVENGSLGQTLKAFGKLSEKLVANYVIKILEGLDYLHRSHVVHCDLKAANILTTKNGNVKLSDFGVSLNLHAVEQKIDVAGTPNWMAPEVIELKGATFASDIWSLGCTVVELLTGKPPYADIPNGLSVMFHIVEDDTPPIPDDCSALMKDFLMQCFHKDPAMRPSAEVLFEHEWLRVNWEHHKELRPQDSIPFLRRVSADLHKNDLARHLSALDVPFADSPHPPFWDGAGDLSSSPVGRFFGGTPLESEMSLPRAHSFVKTTFSKTLTCRVCHLPIKKQAVLCEECSLIAHPRCATEAPATCDVRAQLLLFAHYAQPHAAVSADLHHHPASPTTPTPNIPMTPSIPIPSSPPPSSSSHDALSASPPAHHRLFPWKRRSATPLASPDPTTSPKRRSKASDDHSRSRVSLTTSSHQSSMRSAVTAADTISSRTEENVRIEPPARTRASITVVEPEPTRSSRMTQATQASTSTAEYPDETGRRRKNRESISSRASSRNGCTIQ